MLDDPARIAGEIPAGAGVPDDRFGSVAGKADTEPMLPDNPDSAG